jgi:raffinose/stachyose/melibiose transport system substrate-binding protein
MRTHVKLAFTLSAALLISLVTPATHALPTRAAATTTITVWDIQTGSQAAALQAEADAFHKANPSITVKYNMITNATYDTALNVAMGAHHGPDIFMGWGGGGLKTFVDAGDVVDLTSALNADPAWKARYQAAVLGTASFDGHYYGVPYNGSQPEAIIYNKAIFAKYGLSVPTTWPQLLQVVSTLKSHNVIPFALGGQSLWPEMMIVQYLANRIGGPSAFNDISLHKAGATFNSPVWLQAATMAQDFVKAGAFEKGFSGFGWAVGADANKLLFSGRAAMMFMGVWELGMIHDNAPQLAPNVGIFNVPSVPGGKGKTTDLVGNPANYYSVNKDSKNQAAAIAYLKTTLNPTFNAALLATGEVPPVATLDASTVKDPLEVQQIKLLQAATNFQLSGDRLLPLGPGNDLNTFTSSLFNMSITPQQFCNKMQASIEAYWAKNPK